MSANQASADAAKAYCQRVDACAAVFVTDAFGDEATCESLFEAQLLTDLSAPGTSATPAMYETCADGAVCVAGTCQVSDPSSCK